MENLLTRKLELFGPLPDADKQLLDDVISLPCAVPAHADVAREGEAPQDVHLILEGFACRYKGLKDGRRQIMAYLIPGDLCDFNVFILKKMDHSIGTLAPSLVVDIPRRLILEMVGRPAIAQALWWSTLVDEATLREWLVNLGQREAEERIAHLFCEVHLRMQSIGLSDERRFSLPITQEELGDTMGISYVHVNRSLQSLRNKGLITFKGKEVEILELGLLREISGFDPNYLHLDGGKSDSRMTSS